MAFTTIPSTLYQVGKAVKKLLFTYLVENQDDINTRLGVVEAGANKVVIYDELFYLRQNSTTLTGVDEWRAPSAFTLLDAKVTIGVIGTATGTIEFDIQKSADRDPANFSTVFTTKPSIALAAASDYDTSTNAVIDAGQVDISTGNFLRIDFTQMPVGMGVFHIYLIGEYN